MSTVKSKISSVPRADLAASDGGWRWALSDAWTVARRDMLQLIRQPGVLIGVLVWPVVMVIMFAYVFGGAMMVPDGGNYREYLMPGMFVMTVAFGFINTAVRVVEDKEKGVTDRFRSMPMSPSAVVIGRSIADMVFSSIELALLVICGLVVGWQTHTGFASTMAGIGLLYLLRFALIWVGIFLGMAMPSVQAVTNLYGLAFPFTMFANTFVSPEFMPGWLGAISAWNPLSSTASATRELWGNPGVASGSWVEDNAMMLSVVWPLVLIAIFLPLSVRKYRALSK